MRTKKKFYEIKNKKNASERICPCGSRARAWFVGFWACKECIIKEEKVLSWCGK